MTHKVKLTKWQGPMLRVYSMDFETLDQAKEHAHKHKHTHHNIKIYDESNNLVTTIANGTETPNYA